MTTEAINNNLNILIDPTFTNVNRLFVLAYQTANDSKDFATKKWYIINDENNTNYGVNKDTGADNPYTIKYDTRVLKPNFI